MLPIISTTTIIHTIYILKDMLTLYGPRFFAFFESITFCTSVLARLIASAGMDADSDPFGSGRPSLGLKYFQIDIV